MDAAKTASFELGSGDDACLLLHGFTGSPWDLRPLGDALAARGYAVRCPRLPGHGTTPRAMDGVTYRDWEGFTEEVLLSMGGHRRLFVTGFSMGALLALRLAAKHPARVRGLGLVAPALRLSGLKMKLLRATRRLPFLEWAYPYIDKDGTDVQNPAAHAEAPILAAFPSPRLKDLFTLQDRAVAVLERVTTPTLVAMAEHDHVVDFAAGRSLVERLTRAPQVRFVRLKRGFHIAPRDFSGPELSRELATFFDRLRQES